MPSAFTHAFAAASMASLVAPGRGKLIALAAIAATLPDADALAFRLGIPYESMLGHRGLTHSVAFAACFAALTTWALVRSARTEVSAARLGTMLLLAMVSHGVLDAMTNGGLGVAFFAPFSGERFFFPWRPILVSPIALRRFFSPRGLVVLANEARVVWVPFALLWIGGSLFRYAQSKLARKNRPR